MDELTRDSLLIKYKQGTISEAEKQQLVNWINLGPMNQQFFEEIQQAWDLVQDPAVEVNFATDEEWLKLIDQVQLVQPGQTNELNSPSGVRRLNPWIWRSIAAGLLLLLTAYFIIVQRDLSNNTNKLISINTNKGSKQRHLLPDGSIIWMNENSTMRYPQEFGEDKRDIYLTGEAFFEVAKDPDKPFIIHSNHTLIQVLGTSFNLKTKPEDETVEVTVVSGKVSFSKEDTSEQSVILTAGMKGLYHKKQDSVYHVVNTDPNFRSWQDNHLVFKDLQLKEVIPIVEKQYKTIIKPGNAAILNCRFTSTFDKARLEEVLETITVSLDLHYQYDGQKYILTGDGCQ